MRVSRKENIGLLDWELGSWDGRAGPLGPERLVELLEASKFTRTPMNAYYWHAQTNCGQKQLQLVCFASAYIPFFLSEPSRH